MVHLVAAIAEAGSEEDVRALWGVFLRNRLDQEGDLDLLADAISNDRDNVVKYVLPVLKSEGLLSKPEFVDRMLRIAASNSCIDFFVALSKYPEVKARVEKERHAGYLESFIRSNNQDRGDALKSMLKHFEIAQSAKDQALFYLCRLGAQSHRESRHHYCLEVLLGAGADPLAKLEDEERTSADFMAQNGADYPDAGKEWLAALARSKQWPAVLSRGAPRGFAGQWFNSFGDMASLTRSLNGLPGKDWLWGDSYGLVEPAILEAHTDGWNLFPAIKKKITEGRQERTLSIGRALEMVDAALGLVEVGYASSPSKTPTFSWGSDFPKSSPRQQIELFWKNEAPKIALLFDRPTAWKEICEKTAQLLSETPGPDWEGARSAFIEKLRLDLSTPLSPSPIPGKSRRL